MQSRFDMEAVSKLLQDLSGNHGSYFGGKVVCFCGDFRQTLPVIPGAKSGEIIDRCMQKAEFFAEVHPLDLTINERLNNPNLTRQGRLNMTRFAEDLLKIGDGDTILQGQRRLEELAPWPHGHLLDQTVDALITKIYPTINKQIPERQYLADRAILAVTNKDAGRINNHILTRLQGEEYKYKSIDQAANSENANMFGPEYFNGFWDASLPPHILTVKVGTPVMLLRNLDPPRLCNGTRLRITRCGNRVLEGEIMAGQFAGEKVTLFRTPLQSKDNNLRIPVPFIRKQYPVRPAFAMTVNKSQGQSMKYVGINIQSVEAFAHGQLYVGVSRVTNDQNLYIIGPDCAPYNHERLIKNVVYKQVLMPAVRHRMAGQR